MDEKVEEKLQKIPVVGKIVSYLKTVKLPGDSGLSVYDLGELYTTGIVKGTFTTRAGSVAFSFFMALFPFFLFLINLVPYVPVDDFQEKFLNFIYNILPPHTKNFFEPILLDIAANPRGGLLSLTLLFAIILTANGVNTIFTGFEYSYHTSTTRTIVRQYIIALGVSILLAVILIITTMVIIYYQFTINNLDQKFIFTEDNSWISSLGSYLFFVALIYSIIAILYYFGTKEGRDYRFFSAGALMTTILFIILTYFFGIYINNFSTYNQLYGSVGALLIMMVYIWLNSNLLLLGFELNAALFHLKSRH